MMQSCLGSTRKKQLVFIRARADRPDGNARASLDLFDESAGKLGQIGVCANGADRFGVHRNGLGDRLRGVVAIGGCGNVVDTSPIELAILALHVVVRFVSEPVTELCVMTIVAVRLRLEVLVSGPV